MRRKLFTTTQFFAEGGSPKELRWGQHIGKWSRVVRGVYGLGRQKPTPFEIAVGRSMIGAGPARGLVSAKLLDLDGISIPRRPLPRRRTMLFVPDVIVIDGIPSVSALQAMFDLATIVDDPVWEQANECALHRKHFAMEEQRSLLPSAAGCPGVERIRRVLALRPDGAPPTESVLETLAVQLIRALPGVPEPSRQHRIVYEDRRHHRIDLCWPDIGLFLELDGQGHKNQPVYDSLRGSAIVAETGWLGIRVTWDEVVRYPHHTARRITRVVMQARRRPLPVAA